MTVSANHLIAMAAITRSCSSLYTPLQNSQHSFSRLTQSHIMGSFFNFCSFFVYFSTIPPKGKAKKGSVAATAVTPKNSSKRPAHKSQPLQVFSLAIGEDLCDLNRTFGNPAETESGLTSVMVFLMEISSCLEEVKADKAATGSRICCADGQHLGPIGDHLQASHFWQTPAT